MYPAVGYVCPEYQVVQIFCNALSSLATEIQDGLMTVFASSENTRAGEQKRAAGKLNGRRRTAEW